MPETFPNTATSTTSSLAENRFRYRSWWLLLFVAAWGLAFSFMFPHPLKLFARNCIYIPVGFCGAFLGNISAVGGGVVFIPIIVFLFRLDPLIALKVSLGSQCFGMTSGAIGWMQKKVIPLRALSLTIPSLLAQFPRYPSQRVVGQTAFRPRFHPPRRSHHCPLSPRQAPSR